MYVCMYVCMYAEFHKALRYVDKVWEQSADAQDDGKGVGVTLTHKDKPTKASTKQLIHIHGDMYVYVCIVCMYCMYVCMYVCI